MPETKKYKVISLGNIKGECGWEVNDAHYTGDEIELPDPASLQDIMKALKEAGVLVKHATRRSLYVDWESGYGGYSYYLRAKKDHRWLWELRVA